MRGTKESHGPSARRRLYTRQKLPIEHFGPMFCSYVFSYSYSKRPSVAIRPIGPQGTANRFDQRSASPQFKQPSSTSTVSLSTASLSTSTTKSDARHERIPRTECEEEALHTSKTTDRALRSNVLFVRFLVLVLSIAVLVLVLEPI